MISGTVYDDPIGSPMGEYRAQAPNAFDRKSDRSHVYSCYKVRYAYAQGPLEMNGRKDDGTDHVDDSRGGYGGGSGYSDRDNEGKHNQETKDKKDKDAQKK